MRVRKVVGCPTSACRHEQRDCRKTEISFREHINYIKMFGELRCKFYDVFISISKIFFCSFWLHLPLLWLSRILLVFFHLPWCHSMFCILSVWTWVEKSGKESTTSARVGANMRISYVSKLRVFHIHTYHISHRQEIVNENEISTHKIPKTPDLISFPIFSSFPSLWLSIEIFRNGNIVKIRLKK